MVQVVGVHTNDSATLNSVATMFLFVQVETLTVQISSIQSLYRGIICEYQLHFTCRKSLN